MSSYARKILSFSLFFVCLCTIWWSFVFLVFFGYLCLCGFVIYFFSSFSCRVSQLFSLFFVPFLLILFAMILSHNEVGSGSKRKLEDGTKIVDLGTGGRKGGGGRGEGRGGSVRYVLWFLLL